MLWSDTVCKHQKKKKRKTIIFRSNLYGAGVRVMTSEFCIISVFRWHSLAEQRCSAKFFFGPSFSFLVRIWEGQKKVCPTAGGRQRGWPITVISGKAGKSMKSSSNNIGTSLKDTLDFYWRETQ